MFMVSHPETRLASAPRPGDNEVNAHTVPVSSAPAIFLLQKAFIEVEARRAASAFGRKFHFFAGR
jgi:hypothetical protein